MILFKETFKNSPADTPSYLSPKGRRGFHLLILLPLALLLVVSWYIYTSIFIPPTSFPVNQTITIPFGASVRETGKQLSQAGFIKSELSLYLSLMLWHRNENIKASTYIFSEPLSAKKLITELTLGHYTNDLIKLTFIEGERTDQIADRASALLPNFDKEKFLELAKTKEGELFPDTYHVPNSYNANDLFTLLTTTYKEKTLSLRSRIETSSLTEIDILKLASILEREANTGESMRLVSGILQRRLSLRMPLQVDATLEYVLDKPLGELTAKDLEIDSPYNTYKNLGLPPTPIGNPGLEAIKAVLEPEETGYLFYITDDSGQFHFAKTFEEHKRNIALYLH